jgi:hypothetical protein
MVDSQELLLSIPPLLSILVDIYGSSGGGMVGDFLFFL